MKMYFKYFRSLLLITFLFISAGKSYAEPSPGFKQARIYLEEGQYENAEAIYDSILASPPDANTEILSRGGLIAIDVYKGNMEAAVSSAGEFISLYLSDDILTPSQLYIADAFCSDITEAFCSTGNAKEAKTFFTHILESYPALQFLANVCLIKADIILGNTEEADSNVDNLLSNLPKDRDLSGPIIGIANYYHGEEEYDSARDLYQYVLETWPACEEAQFAGCFLIRCNIMIGNIDTEQAITDVNDLLRDLSGNEDISAPLMEIADCFLKAEQNDLARQLYQYVIETWPDCEGIELAYSGIVRSYTNLDDYDEQASVDSLISNFPNHPYLVYLVGEEYYGKALAAEKEGRAAEAEENYTKTLNIWQRIIYELPTSKTMTPQAYYGTADCYFSLGKYQKAIENCQSAELWKDFRASWQNQFLMARCYEKMADSSDISKQEASEQILKICEKLRSDYSKPSASHAAKILLKKWHDSSN